jgi:ABC-2 type transport system permease protein
LTYVVDAMRASMLEGGTSVLGMGLDYAVLFAVTVVLVLLGAKLYPRLAI